MWERHSKLQMSIMVWLIQILQRLRINNGITYIRKRSEDMELFLTRFRNVRLIQLGNMSWNWLRKPIITE